MRTTHLIVPRLTVALVIVLLAPCVVAGTFSVDKTPCETPWDPGDLFTPGGPPPFNCDMDDGDTSCPPPMFMLPNPADFDMDAFAIEAPLDICPVGVPYIPGLLFSIDDGDPGAGTGKPNHATEIFFYDYCRATSALRRSYNTTMTESALGLGADPPPASADDDVDAFDTRSAATYYQQGSNILFSPDTPSDGGLGAGSEGKIWFVNTFVAGPMVWATPAQLGVPDSTSCNIDGIAPIYESQQSWVILFTTDDAEPCGLDPGDIYASDLAGNLWLWADDVTDLKIAFSERDAVDVDALAINDGGTFQILDPYEPIDPTFYKADWPNYSPSGMPDFEQERAVWPLTYCGPTAIADSFWWFDSELECDRDRTSGDPAETEPDNNTCNQADLLGEVPPIPASLLSVIEDFDWYYFDVPPKGRGGYDTCSITISTCALRQPGDADTHLELYDGCTVTGTPGKLLASDDNACAPDLQSEIQVKLQAGFRYWVKVWGFGDPYTLSLGIDCYPMVGRYGSPFFTPDDHSEQNPMPLIADLAFCMNTDDQQGTGSGHLGTRVAEMQACVDGWLAHNGIGAFFTEQTAIAPAFEDTAQEIRRSEDVVLLLGFYWQDPLGGGAWTRCGGHYVTAAGVEPLGRAITLSDPELQNAEPPPIGNGGPGRVLGPKHTHLPGALPPDHDDAVNVSHDRYFAGPSQLGLPASQWALPAYGTAGGRTVCSDVYLWCMGMDYGQNPSPLPLGTPDIPCPDSSFPVSTEIEAMVDVSPLQSPVCVFLSPAEAWPNNLHVDKGACPNPAVQAVTYDVIRGKVCNPRLKTLVAQVDLGQVQCLYDDSTLDQFDDKSPDHTDCFGGWFYLIRQSTDTNYGLARVSGISVPRTAGSGDCP